LATPGEDGPAAQGRAPRRFALGPSGLEQVLSSHFLPVQSGQLGSR